MDIPIQYDTYGKMKYHPDYHGKHGTPWSYNDLQYLIKWYYIIGPEEMSFALERTMTTVSHKAKELTKQGVMIKPVKSNWHRRINNRTNVSI